MKPFSFVKATCAVGLTFLFFSSPLHANKWLLEGASVVGKSGKGLLKPSFILVPPKINFSLITVKPIFLPPVSSPSFLEKGLLTQPLRTTLSHPLNTNSPAFSTTDFLAADPLSLNFGTVNPLKKRLSYPAFNMEKIIRRYIKENFSPLVALEKTRHLEVPRPKQLFETFATVYYRQHFKTITPHLEKLFKKLDSLQDKGLQERFIKRMRFLIENKENFRQAFSPQASDNGIRLRYLRDIDALTAQNFQANDLVISFETRLHPRQAGAVIRHVNAASKFSVGKSGEFPIYHYSGPLEFLPHMYRYLLNGKHLRKQLTLIFDTENFGLSMYNEDKTLWIRITDHEYTNPNFLHVHLNEIRRGDIVTTLNQTKTEVVNFNLSIPISTPANLPAYNRRDFLYRQLVLNPVAAFRGDTHITIKETSLFSGQGTN